MIADNNPVENLTSKEVIRVEDNQITKVIEEIRSNSATQQELSLGALNVLPSALEIATIKGKAYGNSFCKYGHSGVFFNLARKMDRLEMLARKSFASNSPILDAAGSNPETFVDTLVDLVNYGVLWLGYIAKTEPEKLKPFLSEEEYKNLLVKLKVLNIDL